MRTLFKIDGIRYIVLLSALSNLIEGIAFAQLLQIPYLDLFSPLFSGGNKLSEVALFLLVYRLGRLIISISDSKLPTYLHKNGIIVAMTTIGLGLILITFSLTNTTNLISLSALLFGMGTTLSGLNLREILTTDSDLDKKRKFNILSNVGWSIGVGLSGLLLNKVFFKFELLIGSLLLLSVFIFSLNNSNNFDQIADDKNEDLAKAVEFKKPHLANRDLLFLFAISALMTGLITNQINSAIMSQVIDTFHITEGYQSLVLLLPILGSLLSLVPTIKAVFKRFQTFFEIGMLNLIYFFILLFLFFSTNIYLYCFLLALVGLLSNEVLTALYQAVAIKQEAGLRRATHSLIESVTVVGAMIIWLLYKMQITSVVFNFALILGIPIVLFLFLTDFNLIFKESSSYDQTN